MKKLYFLTNATLAPFWKAIDKVKQYPNSTGFRPTVTLETYADSARHVDGFHDIDFTPIMTRTAMHWEDKVNRLLMHFWM